MRIRINRDRDGLSIAHLAYVCLLNIGADPHILRVIDHHNGLPGLHALARVSNGLAYHSVDGAGNGRFSQTQACEGSLRLDFFDFGPQVVDDVFLHLDALAFSDGEFF